MGIDLPMDLIKTGLYKKGGFQCVIQVQTLALGGDPGCWNAVWVLLLFGLFGFLFVLSCI
jgi:hypothetical protein